MVVSYNKLWKLLIDKGMTKTEMRKATGLGTNALARMGKNEPESFGTLALFTTVMDCDFGDIVEIQSYAEKAK